MSDPGTAPGQRTLRLRRDDHCVRCGADLPAGTHAVWDPRARVTRCTTCPGPVPEAIPVVVPAPRETPDLGVAGASAQREYDRRESRRRAAATAPARLAVNAGAGAAIGAVLAVPTHTPLLILVFAGMGFLKSFKATPQHIQAWRSGADGERAVGARLDTLRGDGVLTVHDRRIPGSRANIDHIAVAPSGIYVVDSKNHAGKVVVTRSGLTIAGRRCDHMVPGVQKQVAVVRQALADQHLAPDLVHGVLCFTRADLPWLRPAPGGVQLLYRKALVRELRRPGPLTPDEVRHLAEVLATRLPPA
jgi:hypothetical protein